MKTREKYDYCSECGIYAEDGDFTEWCWEDACVESRADWFAHIADHFITGAKRGTLETWLIAAGEG